MISHFIVIVIKYIEKSIEVEIKDYYYRLKNLKSLAAILIFRLYF